MRRAHVRPRRRRRNRRRQRNGRHDDGQRRHDDGQRRHDGGRHGWLGNHRWQRGSRRHHRSGIELVYRPGPVRAGLEDVLLLRDPPARSTRAHQLREARCVQETGLRPRTTTVSALPSHDRSALHGALRVGTLPRFRYSKRPHVHQVWDEQRVRPAQGARLLRVQCARRLGGRQSCRRHDPHRRDVRRGLGVPRVRPCAP